MNPNIDNNYWKPSKTLKLLLIFTALTTLPFWLPFIRGAFDGVSYQWNSFGFGGAGIRGDYWFVVLGSTFAISIQFLGWRGAKFPVHILMSGWFLFLASGAFYLALDNPESFRFRGDTLGIDFSLAWIGPVLFGSVAITAIWWSWNALRNKTKLPVAAWSSRNTYWVVGLAALLPVQFVLLRIGTPHGVTDQIGVILTIIQWFVIGITLSPAEKKHLVHQDERCGHKI